MPLVEHLIFLKKNHDVDAFRFVIIDRLQPQEYNHRDVGRGFLKEETYWIHKFRSFSHWV